MAKRLLAGISPVGTEVEDRAPLTGVCAARSVTVHIIKRPGQCGRFLELRLPRARSVIAPRQSSRRKVHSPAKSLVRVGLISKGRGDKPNAFTVPRRGSARWEHEKRDTVFPQHTAHSNCIHAAH